MINKFEEMNLLIEEMYPQFGVNKKQEVARLLLEIVKREGVSVDKILADYPYGDHRFHNIKKYLLARRFPNIADKERRENSLLFGFKPTAVPSQKISRRKIVEPKFFYAEHAARHGPIVERFRKQFPDANYQEIASYHDYIKDKTFSIDDYNKRREQIFFIHERFEFSVPCPCSAGATPCGYSILNLGQGCPFDCTYCFLQGYVNSPGIVLPVNIDDFLKHIEQQNQQWRLGSGQFTDSLVFDDLTEYSKSILDFFARHPDWLFEFKTKSNRVANLCARDALPNVYVGWSLNPQKVIDVDELGTASLAQRLAAAQRCVSHEYKVTFHFDPIICYEGWESDYEDLVAQLFTKITEARIAWISLGGLRLTPHLKKMVESRFPDSHILDGEMLAGFDGKLRYPLRIRKDIYQKMLAFIRKHSQHVYVYLCMEEDAAWQDIDVDMALTRFWSSTP